MNISIATRNEYAQLVELDHHISTDMMKYKIDQGEIVVAIKDTSVIGWLRYGYFWDSIPFMNMLTVIEEYRGQGIGTQLASYWEACYVIGDLMKCLHQHMQTNAVNSSIENSVTRIVEPYSSPMNHSKSFCIR